MRLLKVNAINKSMKNLSTMKEGRILRILEITGGSSFRSKMIDQGIIPGAVIEVISKGHEHGPVLIKVSESKVALGYGMAKNILVTLV